MANICLWTLWTGWVVTFILEKIKKNKAILGETDKYGKRYTVDMVFSKNDKKLLWEQVG